MHEIYANVVARLSSADHWTYRILKNWIWHWNDLFAIFTMRKWVLINLCLSFLYFRMQNPIGSPVPNTSIVQFMWFAVLVANFSIDVILSIGNKDQHGTCIEKILLMHCQFQISLSFNLFLTYSHTSLHVVTFNVIREVFLADHKAFVTMFSTCYNPCQIRCRWWLFLGNALKFSSSSTCCPNIRRLVNLFFWHLAKHALLFPPMLSLPFYRSS